MALTKVSEGGFKDDAVSQAKIADEAVDEARLQVSNAGSNGQFLQKQSGNTGGLTWAAVPAGVGGANQLQLNDSVKIKLGTGEEYEIYNDSSNLVIDQVNDSLTTYIRCKQNGNVTFDASDTGNQIAAKFKWSNDSTPVSSAEFYYGGVKKAETVTGGFTVTGACTATSFVGDGSSLSNLPAGGNTFTAVANGAIANNKAVKIDTDGKVSEITESLTALTSTPDDRSAAQENSWSEANNTHYDAVWHEQRSRLLVSSRLSAISRVTVFEYSSALGTDTSTDHGTTNAESDSCANNTALAYDPDTNQFILAYNYSNDGYVRMGTLAADNSITYGTRSQFTSENANWIRAVYDTNENKVIIVYCIPSSSEYDLYAVAGTVSGTGISGWGTPVQLSSCDVDLESFDACWDSTNNKVIVAFKKVNDSEQGYVVALSNSGTTITWGTPLKVVNGPETKRQRIVFNADKGKAVITYVNKGNDRGVAQVVYVSSGTTMAKGGEAEFANNLQIDGHSLVYDSVSKKVFFLGGNAGDNAKGTILQIQANDNNTITYDGNPVQFNANIHSSDANQWAAAALGSYGKIITVGREGGNQPRVYLFETVAASSNLTDGVQYVGYADQAYTNGQTATIKTTGNNVDTLSGLTAGTKYFVQPNGTLGTSAGTPPCLAGLALSSSKLLIREGKDT